MQRVLIAVHPEPGTDNHELRWVVPPGTLPFVGAVAHLPTAIDNLVTDATIESVSLEPTAVRIRVAPGRTWREEGGRVREALQAALARPEEWRPVGAVSADAVLRMAAVEVIDGEVGAYVRSHGGQVELIDVHDDQVDLRLDGACTHCPGSDVTLHDRFEHAIRARYPALQSVNAAPSLASPPGGARRWLSLTVLRNR